MEVYSQAAWVPARCDLCGAGFPGPGCLCGPCLYGLLRIHIACACCGLPLPAPGLCGSCLREPPPYCRTVAPFRYGYPLDVLLKKFKYGGQLRLVEPLSLALARRIRTLEGPLPELLVPVPLHAARQYARGFNQSLEICRVLRRALAIPYDCRIVRRCRMTAPMFALTPAERRRNIRGAFRVIRSLPARHVAIVDDIMTSGATVRELTRVLLQAGATRVEVWALARAEPP